MDTLLLDRSGLAAAGHPFDALTSGERRLLAQIEAQTCARIRSYARYTVARRHDLGDACPGLGACEFAAFVLAKDAWVVGVFLDWLGVRAADPGPPPPDHAVDQLIEVLLRFDEALAIEAAADIEAFFGMSRCRAPREGIELTLRARYRGRFIASPRREPRFARRLACLVTPAQLKRIETEVP